MPSSQKPKIVVLGSGFAAFSFLKEIDTDCFDVTAISPRNHFIFTPLLPSTTVGTLEFRSIIEPIRVACPNVHFYQAYCRSVFPEKTMIAAEGALDKQRFELPYDKLFIAAGAVSSTYNIPGVTEHTLFLKDLADARAIRQRIIECFERASYPAASETERKRLLHFVVVGGGPTGVEFAAELHDFVTEDLRKVFLNLIPDINITLLEAGGQILSTFDQVLSAYTMKLFRRRRIHVRTNSPVTRVEEEMIVLQDGTQIPYGLVVWSTGIGPTEFVQSLSLPKDRDGRLIVDNYFLVEGAESIFSAGDCSVIKDHPLPATSQVAQQQGRYLAHHFRRLHKGKPALPFRYRHYGMLAYVGGNKALADLAAFKGRGFSAWIFWRSAYLTKLVSMKNKVLVVFDWIKTFVFGRDISRF